MMNSTMSTRYIQASIIDRSKHNLPRSFKLFLFPAIQSNFGRQNITFVLRTQAIHYFFFLKLYFFPTVKSTMLLTSHIAAVVKLNNNLA